MEYCLVELDVAVDLRAGRERRFALISASDAS
jgi:hypothetical protein